jgi:hypothetical protein
MTNATRNELRDALSRRAAAESALELARQATARGREVIETISREIEGIEAIATQASSDLVIAMKATIAGGGTPSTAANDRELAKNDVARTALDARRQVTEQAVAELVAEERECEHEASEATVAVKQAVEAVLRAEAEKIAASWLEVERKARAIRIRLGGLSGDPILRLPGTSTKVGRALYQNREDEEFERPQGDIMCEPWTKLSAALIHDADARLDFTAADLAIEESLKERAERQAANERILARMRGQAA